MNLLDENFPDDQGPRLRRWRIPFRQVGREVGRFGVKDDDLIRLLHQHRRITFFTQDLGFLQPSSCHAAYCLVCLDVLAHDTADYVRRFLRHPRSRTWSGRSGIVARVHHDGLQFWLKDRISQHVGWTDDREK